jgi:hypothetical protein
MRRIAAVVLETLKSLYEGQTVTEYGALLSNIIGHHFNNRYGTIGEHMAEYEKRWNSFSAIMTSITLKPAADGFSKALKILAKSDQAKAKFLLQSIKIKRDEREMCIIIPIMYIYKRKGDYILCT